METDTREKRFRQSLRVLRPLAWWVILVLILYGYRTHQRLLDRTVVRFSTVLQGRLVDYEAAAILDGRRITSGDRVPIGWHTFSISHPQGEPSSTNLFIWYGEHNLGKIALNRSQGTLAIECNPPAALLTIRGPELRLTLTNSTGVTTSVPTDHYQIEATYRHWKGAKEVTVSPNSVATWRCIPRIGNLQMACNQTGATFQLLGADGDVVETGELPSTISGLPEGSYKVIAVHHDSRQEVAGFVETGMTRNINVEFVYGAAVLETKPSGATVESSNGHSWGITPLYLEGLRPGQWEFVLRRDGYEIAHVSLEVAANQTNSFSTNLVSRSYVRAMESARQYLKQADYKRALEASGEALVANPSDPEAAAIQREATKQGSLLRAKALAAKGDFEGATGELEVSVLTLPEDAELKQLLADYRKHEQDRVERQRQEQTSPAKKLFDAVAAGNHDASLFESHELKTGKSVGEVEAAIVDAFRNTQPPFVVTEPKSPKPETFVIEARQELPAGRRGCLIVGGQTRPDETQILFKVIEYTTGQSVTVLGVLSVKSNIILTPIHSSRVEHMTDALQAQVEEGIRIVTARLRQAVE